MPPGLPTTALKQLSLGNALSTIATDRDRGVFVYLREFVADGTAHNEKALLGTSEEESPETDLEAGLASNPRVCLNATLTRSQSTV